MSGPVTLVLRLSAMGDVAMTLPVIKSLSATGRRVVIVTKNPFSRFFTNIKGVEVLVADTTGMHRGLRGILRLYRDIRSSYNIEKVIDLHDVIRSKILVVLFRMAGYRASVIDKGRAEKRRFIRMKGGVPLKNSVDRYLETFAGAGIKLVPGEVPLFEFSPSEKEDAKKIIASFDAGDKKKIALAPFARHDTKSWEPVRMKELIELLAARYNAFFFLMGGPDEAGKLSLMVEDREDACVVAGRYNLRTELALLTLMDLMISMDSSNMHLAALSGVNTVSIWGGTHPGTGFSPYGSQQHLFVQVPLSSLDCRPCTVYGSGGCKRSSDKFKCLTDISSQMVLDRIIESGII